VCVRACVYVCVCSRVCAPHLSNGYEEIIARNFSVCECTKYKETRCEREAEGGSVWGGREPEEEKARYI